MRTLLLFVATLIIGNPASAACECLWEGSFSEVHSATDLVVSGAIVSTKGNSVDLTVERVLSGNAPINPLRIWLETADYCRPPASLFPPNSQWVMALHKIRERPEDGFNPSTPNRSFGRIGDYSLSSCGGYWLNLSGNRVTGNLINAPRWVREPKMTPVLLDVLTEYVTGKIGQNALLEASREDPALRELMLDTRSFLRSEN